MKLLSDQIREAIEGSCVSRYVLAEQAGIAESVLSRFMSGKQGISSSTLDKIADVLGLQVRVGVQEFRKSPKPGRPKKEQTKMQQVKSLTQMEWDLLAQDAAKDAREKNFSSRRGLYFVQGVGIVYYDNNPYKLPREEDRRENLISQFRAFLKRSKIKERACAYYPTSGESKDYTFAMVIQAEALMLKAVQQVFSAIVDKFVNGWHEGIDLGHPADGDTHRYTIPLSALGGNEATGPQTYWFFNTDETEKEGEGAYHEMIKLSCIAAWGDCVRTQGALQMLQKPAKRDVVLFYCAGRGIIASGEFTEEQPFAADTVFTGDREYHRAIVNLKVLPTPLSYSDILEKTGYQLPVRHILCKIKNPAAITFLLNQFDKKSRVEKKECTE